MQDNILYVQDSGIAILYVQCSRIDILYVQDSILYVQDSILYVQDNHIFCGFFLLHVVSRASYKCLGLRHHHIFWYMQILFVVNQSKLKFISADIGVSSWQIVVTRDSVILREEDCEVQPLKS